MCGSYSPTKVQEVGQAGMFMRKKCVDLAVVPNPLVGDKPLLFALFAASSDPLKSPIGPSELRAYSLNANGSVDTTPIATLSLGGLGAPAYPDPIATALVSDPGDPTSLYLAMGTAWLYRVNIAVNPFPPPVAIPPVPSCAFSPCPKGESMRDLALIQAATGPIIYASLDYGRVAEYTLATGGYRTMTVSCGYLDHIAAATNGLGQIMVAVESRALSAIKIETQAPFGNWGGWVGPCFKYEGVKDPNDPDGSQRTGCTQIRFLTPSTLPTCPLASQVLAIPVESNYNGSIALRAEPSGTFRSYECRNSAGTRIRRVSIDDFDGGEQAGPSGPSIDPCPLYQPQVQNLATYKDKNHPSSDGEVSSLNSGVVLSDLDGLGGASPEGAMLYVTPSPNVDVVPVTGTLSVCPGGPGIPSVCTNYGKSADPNPFAGGLFGQAHWVDPVNPLKEWYLVGKHVWRKIDAQCNYLNECTPVCPSGSVFFLQGGFDPVNDANTGWKLVSLRPGTYGSNPPQGTSMNMKWWQFPAPGEGDKDDRRDSTPYFYSVVDPEDGMIYGTRGSSSMGLKIFRQADLMAASTLTCPAGSNGTGEDLREELPPDWFIEAMTHVEREDPDGSGGGSGLYDPCDLRTLCYGEIAIGARYVFNGRCSIFDVVDPTTSSTRKVIAVAAGTVGADGDQSHTDCQWVPYAGRSMVTIFDITDVVTGFPNAPPVLLRVALGDVRGAAMAVHTKFYASTGKTYAFVSDMCGPDLNGYDVSGRMLVFDVSGTKLFPPAGDPYLRPVGQDTDLLFPVPNTTIVFPKDPVDGLGTNCIDLELDPDPNAHFAYAALGEGGVAVIDVSSPTNPFLVEVLDAPGIAFGVSFRSDPTEGAQMLVGSPRAGMRVFKRP